MSTAPFIPDTAPFTTAQRAWLNGFLAGMFTAGPATAPAVKTVNIYFGSESGNSEALAKQIAKAAKKQGFESKAVGLDKIKVADLTRESFALIVTSTFGDGEPPSNAIAFHEELNAADAPSLANLHYAVLALGDTNYEQFCKFGIDLDVRLAALGAKRLYERADCDVAYEEVAAAWQTGVFSVIDATSLTPSAPAAPFPIPSALMARRLSTRCGLPRRPCTGLG